MPALVSIDWDFFPYNPQEAPGKIVVHPGTPEERAVDAQFFCDWSHSEGHSAPLARILWGIRSQHFANCGLDLVKIFNLDPKRRCTPVETFVEVLQERFRFRPTLDYADSHGMITHQLNGLQKQKNIDIVSFDAHCDLGYGNTDTSRVSCENWLYVALEHLDVRSATIVYPNWKGPSEGLERICSYLEPHQDKINCLTWNEFVQDFKPLRRSLSQIFVCRSSGWTPPWCDPLFEDLLKRLPVKSRVCLDNLYENSIGAFNASERREWSVDTDIEFAIEDHIKDVDLNGQI